MFKTITHIIYDVDGLLLNSESLNERVNQIIARRYDRIFDTKAKMTIAGRTTLDSAVILIDLLNLPLTPTEYLQERAQLLEPLYKTAEPLPGTVELTRHFHKHQIPQAIASSSSRCNFEMKTVRHQKWFQIFDRTVLGDDPKLKNSKPAPDIFLLTAKRLNTSPETCLVFEDSVAGITAAKAAGMSVVAIPDSVLDRKLFKTADLVLNSMAEFEPILWKLPSFSG